MPDGEFRQFEENHAQNFCSWANPYTRRRDAEVGLTVSHHLGWLVGCRRGSDVLIVIAGHHTFTLYVHQNHEPVEIDHQFSLVLRSTYLSKTIQGF